MWEHEYGVVFIPKCRRRGVRWNLRNLGEVVRKPRARKGVTVSSRRWIWLRRSNLNLMQRSVRAGLIEHSMHRAKRTRVGRTCGLCEEAERLRKLAWKGISSIFSGHSLLASQAIAKGSESVSAFNCRYQSVGKTDCVTGRADRAFRKLGARGNHQLRAIISLWDNLARR